MKKLIVLSGFCFVASSIFAQTQPQAVTTIAPSEVAKVAPVETLQLKQLDFDFGKIPQGKPVTHVFEVKNVGKTPFKLDNVVASCGCTTPQWDKDAEVAPGATANITVGYNAAAEGPFNKTITVYYQGGQTKQFFIKGEVWKTPATSAPTNESINDLKN